MTLFQAITGHWRETCGSDRVRLDGDGATCFFFMLFHAFSCNASVEQIYRWNPRVGMDAT